MNIMVNTKISKKAFIIITVFAVILGLCLLYFATDCFIKVFVLKSWNCTEATVIFSNVGSFGVDQTTYRYVNYTYLVNGVEYRNIDQLWWKFTDNNLKENDKITVYYNINNPKDSKVYHISYLLIIFAILFLIFPPLFLNERLKYNK